MPEEKLPPVEIKLPPSLRGRLEPAIWRDAAAEMNTPILAALMQTTFDEHGRQNWEGATIRVKVNNGNVWATVVCPSAKQQVTFQIRSLTALIEEVERGLGKEPVEWEPTWDEVKAQRNGLDKAKRNR